MGKDPALLWYPNDWLGGTMGMTLEQKGAYMELLMAQFNRGHMTIHMIGQLIGQNWVTIQDKFIQDEQGLWYNKRLQKEKEKRQAYVKSRGNNIKGNNQHSKKEKKNRSYDQPYEQEMTSHMENENVNENVDIVVNNGSNKRGQKKFIPPSLDEIKAYCIERNNNVNPQQFFDFYTSDDDTTKHWIDSKGQSVRNWKQKIITWEGSAANSTSYSGKKKSSRYDIDISDPETYRNMSMEV